MLMIELSCVEISVLLLGKIFNVASFWALQFFLRLFSLFIVQVAKVEDRGTIMGEKRKLSRRELEEELQNLQRMNHKFYKFAVEELVKEVYQSSEGTARDK